MQSWEDSDGRWHHKFRQSWLNTTDLCLERSRLEMDETMPKVDSDAACVGTAVHSAIEICLASGGVPLSDMKELFNAEFSELSALPTFRWVKYTDLSARAWGELCLTSWWTEILPTLSFDAQLEESFVVPLVDSNERVIELSGTVDYVDRNKGLLIDWKTSGGGPYRAWEKQRWAVQPTVYTYAFTYKGVVPDFQYVVMHPKGVQRLDVVRTQGDHAWLAAKCVSMARLLEAGLSQWPLNDNHALCSEKWCPAWASCKGAPRTISARITG